MKFPMPTSRQAHCAFLVAATALLALGLAAWAAPRIGRSRVDVALDLAAPLLAPPVVSYGAGASNGTVADPSAATFGGAEAMERVPDRFAQMVGSFELQPTRRHNPASPGYGLGVVRVPASGEVVAEPHGAWQQAASGGWDCRAPGPLAPGDTTTTPTLRWRGPLTDPTLLLWRSAWGGIARLTTPQGGRDLDLYSTGPASLLTESIPAAGTYPRYVVSVPREALGGLRFDFSPDDRPDIRRLYVGSFVPTIAFADATPWPPQVWGALFPAWVPPLAGHALLLPSLSPWEQGRWRTWLLVWALAMAALLGGETTLWCAWRVLRAAGREPADPALALAPWSWRVFLTFLFSCWGVWGVWLGAFWPAPVSPDAWEQWDQMLKGPLADTHPPFFALTMWGLTRLWFTPAVVALAQMAALGVACAWGFAWLVRARVARWAVIAAWVALLASPTVGFLAVALVKDTLYSAAVMGLIVVSAALALEPARRRGWGFWAGLGVLLALVPLYRYNGLLLALPFVVLLWVAVPPARRGLAGAGVLGLVLFALVRYGLFGALHVEHSPYRFGTIYPAWVTAGILANGAPLSGEDAEFVDRLRPLHEPWYYSSGYSTGSVFAGPGGGKWLDLDLAAQQERRFWEVLGRLCERHPGLVLRHVKRATNTLYRVPRLAGLPEQVLAVQMCQTQDSVRRKSAAHGFEAVSFFPSVRAAAVQWLPRLNLDPPWGVRFGWVLWRPALRLYLVLGAGCVVWWRVRRPRLLLPFVPVILNTISLAPSLSSETRYQLPVFLATGFLLCLAFLPRRPAASAPAGLAGDGSRLPAPTRDPH